MRSQVEAGSNDAANPLGSSRRARTSLLIALVSALALATVVLSSAAVADQLSVARFGQPGSEAGQMRTPGGVATDPTGGDVYVADTGNNRIDKFSPEGNFILAFGWGVEDGSVELQTCEATCEFGLPGKGAGEMNEVVGVAVSPVDGDVYTVNRKDGRIQRFTSTGAFVEEFGGYGPEPEELGQSLPLLNDVATDSTGQVFVADQGKGRVAVFGTDGKLASEISGVSVSAIAIGPTGLAYIANEFSEGVSVFEFEAAPAPGAWVFKEELLLRESFGPRGLAINPANENLIALVTSGFEASFAYALKEVNPAGELVATTKLPEIAKPPASSPQEVSYGLAAGTAAAFPEHKPGAVYVVDQVAGQVQVLAEGEPQKPQISGLAVSNLGSGFADLSASLNPEGLPTEYLFEYGTTAGYGNTFPAVPGQAAAGFEATAVGAHLTGLAPSTTYHFRLVATNAKGTAETLDQTFTTFPVGGPAFLPDGRNYEMVTPVEKGHNDVEPRGGLEQRGVAGNEEMGMAYVTLNGLPASETGALLLANVAKRGAGGWASNVASGAEINQTTLATGAPVMVANDMTKALITSKVRLTPEARPGTNIYVHTLSPSSYQLVSREGGGFAGAVGASNDFGRVFFNSGAPLTPDSPPEEFVTKLYEWDGSAVHNVGILPGETIPSTGSIATYGPELRPVAENGSSVVFGAEAAGEPVQVFRRAGGQTIEASASQRGVSDPAGPRPATFVGAAADGSSVFFTSTGKLTDDANTGETSGGEEDIAPNLYRYDVASGRLADLTVDTNGDEFGAAVGKVVVAGNGTVAYFVAEGVLAAGGKVNQPNLYRWSQAGGIEFIAILSPGDGFEREAATNASGNALAFVSTAGLAGRSGALGISEIYHYSTAEGLACASCGLGVMKAGANMPAPNVAIGSGGGKPLSADGRKVFFATADALIPPDTNGKFDAYEWEGGVDSLLSTGAGTFNSYFVDASPSGKDVFITTRNRLLKADNDENTDVYDVREGGGFSEPPGEPAPCEAEACRPPLAAAPAAAQISSQSFNGPHNKKPKHHKKKHHKKHKDKNQKGKAKHGKKSKSKAHSGGKRG